MPKFKNSNSAARILVLAALLGSMQSGNSAFAQQNSHDILEERAAQRNWLKADLKLDNSKYKATRKQIDQLIQQGQKPASLERNYKLTEKDLYDPQKIFRWAYAAYRKQKLAPDQNNLIDVDEVMDRNLKPGAYDWVRLRFLITSLKSFSRPTMQLIDVGRRLLKVQRNDEEVTFHLVRSLQLSQRLSDRKQAIVLAKAMARRFPQDVYWQWMVADSVTYADDFAGRPTYAGNQAAIAEYKKTLQLLPMGHPYRQRLVERIVRLDLDFDDKGQRVRWNRKMYTEALGNTALK